MPEPATADQPARLGAAGEIGLGGAARLVDAGEPAHRRARLPRATPARIRQHRGEQRGLARRDRPHRLVEGIAAPRLGAELAARTPFGDVEIDFQDPPFRQHEVDPQRERKFQRLADEAAPRPEKQVLRHLLGDGRDALRLAEVVGGVDPFAQFAEIDAAMAAEAAILRGDDGRRQRRRHAVDRHEGAFDAGSLGPAREHQGRDRIDETVEHRERVRQQQDDNDDDHQRPEEPPQSAPGRRARLAAVADCGTVRRRASGLRPVPGDSRLAIHSLMSGRSATGRRGVDRRGREQALTGGGN